MVGVVQQKQECPYDPQQMEFHRVVAKLIDAVMGVCAATHSIGAYLDFLYWKGVALARDAHAHPPCQSGAFVRRKTETSSVPYIDERLRSALPIEHDRPLQVIRVIFIPNDKNGSWYLQLEGEQGRIFAEDQFDLIQGS